jgi:nucleotide-binding universal stress UspA family protein
MTSTTSECPISAPRAADLVRSAASALGGPVLVAGGDGEASCGALRLAELLARRDRVNAHVLGVLRPVRFPAWALAEVDPEALEAGRRGKHLVLLRRRVHQTVGRSALFSVDVVTDSPARALAAAARERGSACILVGLAERGTVGRPASEDEALQVTRAADVPVVAVPVDCAFLPRRALVALDFGDGSKRATLTAARLLAPGATLTLAHVEPEADLRALGQEGLAEIYERGVAERFRAIEAELAAERRAMGDTTVETVLLTGEPAPVLLERAVRGAYDLIACGTQGVAQAMSPRERHVTGSVSTALLRGAGCAVLIAPPAATPP